MHTIGADPELFIKPKGKNSPISAWGLIGGTKEKPVPVKNGAVQVDGMALEFNINPTDKKEEFVNNIIEVKNILLSLIDGVEEVKLPTVTFSKGVMINQPSEALELGCEPDFNALTGEINPKPNPSGGMRTAGGHVHIGGIPTDNPLDDEHFNNCRALSLLMDQELGVYSVLWDKDDKRRSLYGRASSFRPKPYGVEYRTLSNSWIFDKSLIEVVFDYTKDAVDKFFEGVGSINGEVIDIINNSDRSNSFFKNNKKAERILDIVGG